MDSGALIGDCCLKYSKFRPVKQKYLKLHANFEHNVAIIKTNV